MVDVAGPLSRAGFGLLLVGLLLSAKIRMSRTERGLSFFTSLRKPLGLAVVGIVLAVVGVAVVIVGASTSPPAYQYPGIVTHSRMANLNTLISAHQKAGEPVPVTMQAMRAAWDLTTDDIQDAWYRNLELRTEPYEIVSAGPDGQFGTRDDLVASAEVHGP